MSAPHHRRHPAATAALAAALAGALLLAPRDARAYQITSAFSDSCHELITLDAYIDVFAGQGAIGVPLPRSEASRKLTNGMFSLLPIVAAGPRERFVMMSLIIGVRFPDTGGHSVLNFTQLREAHSAPDEQYKHALRKPSDDGTDGDRNTVDGVRAWIRRLVDEIRTSRQKPPAKQLRWVKIYLDFYGQFEVQVWEPAFLVGVASHALQDSFSHTIRSDDLRKVHHVLNFADAIVGGYDSARDGLAHSDAMDDCADDQNKPIVDAARAATRELAEAVRDELSGATPGALTTFLDKWLTLQPGCTEANAYCSSRWVAHAKRSPTGPYLGCACRANPRGAGLGAAPWIAALLALVLLRRLRSRRG